MPGQMMHLYVGDLFWKNRGLTGNRGQFLLGCIAPDGVNARGFAPKQQRWHAHLRDQNLEVWKKNALHFYQDHLDFPDLDYLQGYLVHVFTDILWDEFFNQTLEASICSVTEEEEVRNRLRWEELFLFDRLACFQDWWKLDARAEFAKAKAKSIHGIPCTMIELLQKDTLFWYAQTIEEEYGTKPPQFVTRMQAKELADILTNVLKI